MAKKVDITFKNPVNEAYIDHLELWRKTGIGGTFAQVGSDFAFVAGTADYTYADLTASADSETYYYEARAYNNNGGEVEGTDYNKVSANVTISGPAGSLDTPVITYSREGLSGSHPNSIGQDAVWTEVYHNDFTVDVAGIVGFNGATVSKVGNQLAMSKAGSYGIGAINYATTPGVWYKMVVKWGTTLPAGVGTDAYLYYTWGPEVASSCFMPVTDIALGRLHIAEYKDGQETTSVDKWVFGMTADADTTTYVDEVWLYEKV